MPSAWIDVSGLTGAADGYVISALESPRTSITMLARHFGFDAVEHFQLTLVGDEVWRETQRALGLTLALQIERNARSERRVDLVITLAGAGKADVIRRHTCLKRSLQLSG